MAYCGRPVRGRRLPAVAPREGCRIDTTVFDSPKGVRGGAGSASRQRRLASYATAPPGFDRRHRHARPGRHCACRAVRLALAAARSARCRRDRPGTALVHVEGDEGGRPVRVPARGRPALRVDRARHGPRQGLVSDPQHRRHRRQDHPGRALLLARARDLRRRTRGQVDIRPRRHQGMVGGGAAHGAHRRRHRLLAVRLSRTELEAGRPRDDVLHLDRHRPGAVEPRGRRRLQARGDPGDGLRAEDHPRPPARITGRSRRSTRRATGEPVRGRHRSSGAGRAAARGWRRTTTNPGLRRSSIRS
jgi:hypothetical protein